MIFGFLSSISIPAWISPLISKNGHPREKTHEAHGYCGEISHGFGLISHGPRSFPMGHKISHGYCQIFHGEWPNPWGTATHGIRRPMGNRENPWGTVSHGSRTHGKGKYSKGHGDLLDTVTHGAGRSIGTRSNLWGKVLYRFWWLIINSREYVRSKWFDIIS